jgi:hypothetical protein
MLKFNNKESYVRREGSHLAAAACPFTARKQVLK